MKKICLLLATAAFSTTAFAQTDTKTEVKGANGAKMEKKTEMKSDGTTKTSMSQKPGNHKGYDVKMKKHAKASM